MQPGRVGRVDALPQLSWAHEIGQLAGVPGFQNSVFTPCAFINAATCAGARQLATSQISIQVPRPR